MPPMLPDLAIRRYPPESRSELRLFPALMRRTAERRAGGMVRAVLAAGSLGLSGSAAESASPPAGATVPTLTAVGQIRALTPAEAGRGHPVRIRALVTAFRSAYSGGYFVMDPTGSIYVAVDPATGESDHPLEPGLELEISGVTHPGMYAPQIREGWRRVLGRTALPAPPRLTYEHLASGAEDCRYAEIEGVVRRVTDIGLALAIGEGRIEVAIADYDSGPLERLVDARVRLRGVISGRFNQKRQWVGVRFTVVDAAGIEVLRPAPTDPFAGPIRAFDSLLQWELNQAGPHRVKVRGVVTHSHPGETLFIHDGSAGLQVRTTETEPCVPGDSIEVVGFPSRGLYSAVLEDAVYRLVGRGTQPRPVRTTPAHLLEGAHDASLVEVHGTLLESVRQQGAWLLVLQDGEVIFHARLESTGVPDSALPPAGSLLALTGIGVVADVLAEGARLSPRMALLLLRSTSDLQVLRAPSWWTVGRLSQALGALAALVLGILAWVWLLRRQVRIQTEALKERTQREIVSEERTRIAQELHDNLDQELTGISLQLAAARSQAADASTGQRLAVVQRLLQRSQEEVRRSVWDLRQSAAGVESLATVLEKTTNELRAGSTADAKVTVQGNARALPARMEHHVTRIAAEALTNAFRHAAAKRITVELSYSQEDLLLVVADDGAGFDVIRAPNHASGHFGLIGMQERSRKIGGTLRVVSAPQQGTRVELHVPTPLLTVGQPLPSV